MRSRWLTYVGMLVSASLLCWFLPLFHVRPLGSETSGNTTRVPDQPITSVPHKLESYATGSPVTELWAKLDADFASAQKQYGQQAGLGGAWYFRVQGTGTVHSVEKNLAIVEVEGSHRRVHLELGVIVDNTVREAIGVKAKQFLNSQDFNAFSAELNRQVEEEVIKPIRQLLLDGTMVSFVGCTKVSGKSDLDPLYLIPIRLSIVNEPSSKPKDETPIGEGSAR